MTSALLILESAPSGQEGWEAVLRGAPALGICSLQRTQSSLAPRGIKHGLCEGNWHLRKPQHKVVTFPCSSYEKDL